MDHHDNDNGPNSFSYISSIVKKLEWVEQKKVYVPLLNDNKLVFEVPLRSDKTISFG